MIKKKSILLHLDCYKAIAHLPLKEKGLLLESIFTYLEKGAVTINNPIVNIAFNFMRNRIDADNVKYVETCQRNKIAANKRWGNKNDISSNISEDTDACTRIEMHTKNADTDTDTNTDTETDNKKEIILFRHTKNLISENWRPQTCTIKKLKEYGCNDIENTIDDFILQCKAHGYKYSDFDKALLAWTKKAIRKRKEENYD